MISHLPTLLLLIGYPLFWLELYFLPRSPAHTTWIATVLFALVAAGVLWKNRAEFKVLVSLRGLLPVLLGLGALAVMALGFYAASFPPHVPPELDTINYHYTLPRQHLITHGFSHLAWSTADLFPLPLQFSLAPYWFATALPTKWPQALFMIGLCLVAARLAARFAVDGKSWAGLLAIAAVAGSHGFGIQFGTAMLDVPMTYLFLAALDSYLSDRPLLAALEFSFFFWSKSFFPLQSLAIAVCVTMAVLFAKRRGKELRWVFDGPAVVPSPSFKKFLGAFLLGSVVIAGPFVAKSIYYAGTPLYPFGTGALPAAGSTPETMTDLKELGEVHKSVTESYGIGRTPWAFIKHFWVLSVPTQGVNNPFDYPLGLPYLLVLVPFVVFFVAALRRGSLPFLPLVALLFWASWWMGSQQARWLFIPVALMFVSVIPVIAAGRARIFAMALLCGIGLNALSMLRGLKSDIGQSGMEVLRPQDRQLVEMGAGPRVELDQLEIAFAEREVIVTQLGDRWVLPLRGEGK